MAGIGKPGRKMKPRGNCLTCGASLERQPPDAKYCSRKCADARHGPKCVCKQCGGEFRPKVKGRHTFCSWACTKAWNAAHRKPREAPLKNSELRMSATVAPAVLRTTCSRCGRDFEQLRVNRRPWKICPECVGHKRPDRTIAVCSVCGKGFAPVKYGGSTYALCSECRKAAARPIMTAKCPACGKGFTYVQKGRGRHRVYCSEECSVRVNGRRGTSVRRARKQGCEADEKVDSFKVFERDSWRCGICGKKTNRQAMYPDRTSATLDHIVPLSLGGAHTWQNVQCVHYGCNMAKGATGNGQLRLAIDAHREG